VRCQSKYIIKIKH